MQANPDEGKEFYAVLFTRYEGICSNFTAARKLEAQGDTRGKILGVSSFAEAEELFGERGMMVDPQGHLEGCDFWTWRAYRRGMSLYEFPDVEKPETLVAFCAGNAINPRQYNCHAAFACIFPHNRMWDMVERVKGPFMTFKRAGYLALLEAFRRANLEDPAQSKTLVVYSNDESVVNSMRKRVIDWMYDGWVTSSGNPVKNRDLLQLLLASRGNHRAVHFEYVKAGTDATGWKAKWINIAAKAAKTTAQDAAASAKPAFPRPRLCHMPALGSYGGPTSITRYDVLQNLGRMMSWLARKKMQRRLNSSSEANDYTRFHGDFIGTELRSEDINRDGIFFSSQCPQADFPLRCLMEGASPAKADNVAALTRKVANLTKRVENLESCWRMHTQQQITRLKELKKNKLQWHSHMPPSRAPVDEHLRQVSEAFYSIVKVACGDEDCYNTGFCISEDGFLLTINDSCRSLQDENTLEVTFFDGTRLDCTHVQNFQCSGVSLSLLKGDFPIPPLKPDDLFIANESMALVPFGVDDIGFPRPAITVGRVRTPLDTRERLARLELGTPSDTKAGEMEARMTGGPVLSMRPGYFAGVITSLEQSKTARFCPVTLTSSVWLAIQHAMKQYREDYVVEEPTTKQHGGPNCCVLL